MSRNAWNLYIGELQYGSLGYAGSEGILEERYLEIGAPIRAEQVAKDLAG